MLNYVWKHLVDTEPRGQITFDFIKKFIKPDHNYVLDNLCGFAPLKPYFSSQKYFGYDINSYAIETVNSKYPESIWSVCDDIQYIYPADKMDVFIFLGISAGENDTDSKTETATSIRLIEQYKPRLIILETCLGHYQNIKNAKKPHHYDELCDFCQKHYKEVGSFQFDAKLNRAEVSERIMKIYE